MPNFTPLTPFSLEMLDGSLLPMGHNRPKGVHLSEIIREKKRALGGNVEPIKGEDPNLRPLSGFLWERCVDLVWRGCPFFIAFEQAWKEYMSVAKVGMPVERGEVITQLKEELDGILMTPDGFDGLRIESYKATWRSMKRWEEDPLTEFAHWIEAEMGYCKAISERLHKPVTSVRFFILWMQGDYSRKPGRGPQATFTDMTCTQAEIDQNWMMILRYRDWAVKEGKIRVTKEVREE